MTVIPRRRRYRATFLDLALFAIPVAAVVMAAAGRLFGWA